MQISTPSTPASIAEPQLGQVLARNLVMARDLAGMTQHDLASRSGVSRATIAQLESGAGDPRLSTVSHLAEALGVALVVLLARRREVEAIAGIAENLKAHPVTLSPTDGAQIGAFARSPEVRDQRRAMRLAAAVARAAGCRTPGAQAIAGLFAIADPAHGVAAGVAMGRVLD